MAKAQKKDVAKRDNSIVLHLKFDSAIYEQLRTIAETEDRTIVKVIKRMVAGGVESWMRGYNSRKKATA